MCKSPIKHVSFNYKTFKILLVRSMSLIPIFTASSRVKLNFKNRPLKYAALCVSCKYEKKITINDYNDD